ncbi:MAG: hypothetical protein FJ011_08990 [Chloroflexi bacterium]|nr:hypothetical protein [Chloroflexota bacterium]
MPIPDFLPDSVLVFWTRLCAWCSSQVYAVMLAHAQQHLLVRLHARLDLHALVTACAGYHHTAGPGDQPTHPVAYLVRAVLVKTLYGRGCGKFTDAPAGRRIGCEDSGRRWDRSRSRRDILLGNQMSALASRPRLDFNALNSFPISIEALDKEKEIA